MRLEDLGFNRDHENYRKEQDLSSFEVGRVVAEHKERYIVRTDKKEYEAEIIGNLRFAASSRTDFPAVGDWVAISVYDEGNATIHEIFPRQSILERQAVGRYAEKQIIATNIDYTFIIQAVDRDFNINRLERYLTLCHAGGVSPVIVLCKTDLVGKTEITSLLKLVKERIINVSRKCCIVVS